MTRFSEETLEARDTTPSQYLPLSLQPSENFLELLSWNECLYKARWTILSVKFIAKGNIQTANQSY